MFSAIFGLMLTTFVSVNGQIVQTTPEMAVSYEENAVTDIGDPEKLETLEINESAQSNLVPLATLEPKSETQTVYVEENNNDEVALLSEAVELLAENSSTATGTVNSSVLNLMDRIVDNYPDFYKYAGFRTDEDDSYSTTLYLSKRATQNGNTLTFGDDCIAVRFSRYYESNYSGYIYYDVYDSPNASVNINDYSIVYTNAVDGYPSLGTRDQFCTEYIWIGLILVGVLTIFTRKS